MITLEEAKIVWAKKRLKYLKICFQEGNLGVSEESNKLNDDINDFAMAIYSMPHISDHMECWMIDIKFGDEIPRYFKIQKSCDNSLSIKHVETLMNNPQKFTDITGGPLLTSISNSIKELGLRITDRGFSGCGGHIGVPCTNKDKDILIDMMLSKYRKAIDNGLVFPVVAWFKPNFGDLWSEDQIIEFLNEND